MGTSISARVLDLPHGDERAAHVLPAHPHHVAAPLRGVEQQGEGEALARAAGPMLFVQRDFIL